MSEVRLIPLRAKNGTVHSHAIVDADDFDWLNQWRWHRKGATATSAGYAWRDVYVGGPKRIRAVAIHRLLLGLEHGDPRQGDHINLNTLDNRRSNLRIATKAQNAQNVRARPGSSSRFRGVSWDSEQGKWRAIVFLDGRLNHLGRYSDEEEAARVAAVFRAEHMPFSSDAAAA